MGRFRLAAVVLAGVVAAGLVAGLARSGPLLAGRVADETVPVPGGVGGGSVVMSQTVLVASHRYELTVTGTVTYWCQSNGSCLWPEGYQHPASETAGVDALYCYATWRCPAPQLWRPLQIDGQGLDQFAGEEGKIAYNGGHTYTVTVGGVSGALSLRDTAPTDISSLQVRIHDLGGSAPCQGGPNAVRIVSVSAPDPALLDAEVVHADGRAEDAKVGMALCESDRIRTGFRNQVTLSFGGRTTVVIEETSDLKIAVFKQTDVADVELWMKQGGVAAQVVSETGRTNRFRVRTPTVTASSRGTAFSVSYDPRTGASIVDVTKDTVDVLPTRGLSANPPPSGSPEVLVPAGKEVLVSAGKETPLAPIGRAGVPAGVVSRPAARALLERLLGANSARCGLKVKAISQQTTATGWLVSAQVAGGAGSGWATWTITGSKLTPANTLARRISGGCKGVKPPAVGGKAKPGHYRGTTSQGKSISFDVDATASKLANITFAMTVTCTDTSTANWTFKVKPIAIKPDRSFSQTYLGSLANSGNTKNIGVDYTIAGKLTTTGTATGNFNFRTLSYDVNGQHYDCPTNGPINWSTTLGG